MHYIRHLRSLHHEQAHDRHPDSATYHHARPLPDTQPNLRFQSLQSVPAGEKPDRATYQTNPNHPQHSNLSPLRLTLRMLRFLRVPLMVRNAFLAFSLAILVAAAAGAVRIDAVQMHAHATITKSTVHRGHRPAHHAAHSLRTIPRTAHTSAATHTSRAATHRGTHVASSSRRRTTNSARHSATLRRTRYNRYHSGAHFVPLATVPVSSTRPESEALNGVPEAPSHSAETSTAAPLPASSRSERNSASLPTEPTTESAASAETGTVPPTGTDPAAIAAAGNPLVAPRSGTQPVAPTSGQIAELNRPPIFSGRVSSYTLRGTHDSLVRQNARSEEEDLERIEDDADLQDRIAHGLLVRVPESAALTVNAALPEDRRYCRPWTADFLTDLARAHQAQFHTPLVVSSAVRTVEYQKRLMRTNHNAADAEGDIVSPHLTGATIDIAKSGLSRREMEWMRKQLLGYQNAGFIDVEEEFHQRCFHITVYKNYLVASPRRAAKTAPVPAMPVADSSSATPGADATPNNR